jgi:quinoprotein glucose dehydrogenase
MREVREMREHGFMIRKVLILAVISGCICGFAGAQSDAPAGEWRHYAGDRSSSKYSPLDQITRDNVSEMVECWRWEPQLPDGKSLPPGQFKTTPLMIDGVLYATTAFSEVVALDAATGDEIWTYDSKSYDRGRPANSGFQHRGVDYWTDGENERLLIATGGRQLVSIDRKTGKPDEAFGDGGKVDLTLGLGRKINPSSIGFNAPPVVCRDVIVVGSIIFDGPTTKEMAPGHIRGYDVRTGEMKWRFNTIPQAGEFGVETWHEDSWKYSGNTNSWTMMSADEELGYVYAPTGTPTNDWYGGHRKGENLFAETLLCLNAETGERVWHFQAVKHGLWDYDFPAAPNLVDIVVDGKPIKAVAQVSKQAYCYVLNRETGEPVWPMEERPAPKSTVPGEWTSPTQTHPTKPPAFDRQGVTEDDLIDFTPEILAEAKGILKEYNYGPLFTPPSLVGDKKGTIVMAGPAGGANWGGAALDPETQILYVGSMTLPFAIAVAPADKNRSNFDYMIAGGEIPKGPHGLPLFKPPYGRITAIDLNTGEFVWQVPHGDGPKDHPAIKDLNLGPLGSAANGFLSNGGGVLTKTLFFAIQADENTASMMRMGKKGYIRAWDKTNGDLVWEQRIDLTPHATPMTYLHGGKQYVVCAVGGQGQQPTLIAYALK